MSWLDWLFDKNPKPKTAIHFYPMWILSQASMMIPKLWEHQPDGEKVYVNVPGKWFESVQVDTLTHTPDGACQRGAYHRVSYRFENFYGHCPRMTLRGERTIDLSNILSSIWDVRWCTVKYADIPAGLVHDHITEYLVPFYDTIDVTAPSDTKQLIKSRQAVCTVEVVFPDYADYPEDSGYFVYLKSDMFKTRRVEFLKTTGLAINRILDKDHLAEEVDLLHYFPIAYWIHSDRLLGN